MNETKLNNFMRTVALDFEKLNNKSDKQEILLEEILKLLKEINLKDTEK